MLVPLCSEKAGGLSVPPGYNELRLRKSILQLLRQNGYDRVFRAEMIAVDEIDPKLARLQKDAVFDVCRHVCIAAGSPCFDKTAPAGAAEHCDLLNRSAGVVKAQPVRSELFLADREKIKKRQRFFKPALSAAAFFVKAALVLGAEKGEQHVVDAARGDIEVGVHRDHGDPVLDQPQQLIVPRRKVRKTSHLMPDDRMVRDDQLRAARGRLLCDLVRNIQTQERFFDRRFGAAQQKAGVVVFKLQLEWRDLAEYFKNLPNVMGAAAATPLSWLKADGKKMKIEVSGLPKREEAEAGINEQLIVEYYSR